MKKILTKKNSLTAVIICIILAGAILLGISGCAIEAQAADLMENIKPNSVSGKAADEKFIASQNDFAAKLFAECAEYERGKNLLISPLSLELALAMTANGARGLSKLQRRVLTATY